MTVLSVSTVTFPWWPFCSISCARNFTQCRELLNAKIVGHESSVQDQYLPSVFPGLALAQKLQRLLFPLFPLQSGPSRLKLCFSFTYLEFNRQPIWLIPIMAVCKRHLQAQQAQMSLSKWGSSCTFHSSCMHTHNDTAWCICHHGPQIHPSLWGKLVSHIFRLFRRYVRINFPIG